MVSSCMTGWDWIDGIGEGVRRIMPGRVRGRALELDNSSLFSEYILRAVYGVMDIYCERVFTVHIHRHGPPLRDLDYQYAGRLTTLNVTDSDRMWVTTSGLCNFFTLLFFLFPVLVLASHIYWLLVGLHWVLDSKSPNCYQLTVAD